MVSHCGWFSRRSPIILQLFLYSSTRTPPPGLLQGIMQTAKPSSVLMAPSIPSLPPLPIKQTDIKAFPLLPKKLASQKVTPPPLPHNLHSANFLHAKTLRTAVKKTPPVPCVPQRNIPLNPSIDWEKFAERCIVIDTESTGSETGSKNRATEIGCVELVNFEPTGQIFHRLLNPEREVCQYVQGLTGYTWNSLRRYPRFQDVAPEFLDFIEEAGLVIHDAGPELTLIDEELATCRHTYGPLHLKHPILDTLKLAQKLHPGPGKKTNLNALCDYYGIDRSQRHKHSAHLDSKLLAHVFCEMIQRHGIELGVNSISSTHPT